MLDDLAILVNVLIYVILIMYMYDCAPFNVNHRSQPRRTLTTWARSRTSSVRTQSSGRSRAQSVGMSRSSAKLQSKKKVNCHYKLANVSEFPNYYLLYHLQVRERQSPADRVRGRAEVGVLRHSQGRARYELINLLGPYLM